MFFNKLYYNFCVALVLLLMYKVSNGDNVSLGDMGNGIKKHFIPVAYICIIFSVLNVFFTSYFSGPGNIVFTVSYRYFYWPLMLVFFCALVGFIFINMKQVFLIH